MIFTVPVNYFSKEARVCFLWCTDEEAELWKKKQRYSSNIRSMDLNQIGCAYTYKNGFIPVIRFYDSPLENPGLVAHEVFHAVVGMWRHTGAELTAESEEAYAYLVDFITEKFYKQLEKYVDRISNPKRTRNKNKSTRSRSVRRS
jgi:hypothetical protein